MGSDLWTIFRQPDKRRKATMLAVRKMIDAKQVVPVCSESAVNLPRKGSLWSRRAGHWHGALPCCQKARQFGLVERLPALGGTEGRNSQLARHEALGTWCSCKVGEMLCAVGQLLSTRRHVLERPAFTMRRRLRWSWRFRTRARRRGGSG